MCERGHEHKCQRCGTLTACTGELEPNHDGFPIVTCRMFHLDGGQINSEFICDACAELEDRCDEPGDPDGEDIFRDVAAEARDAADEAWKLKQ